MTERTQSGLRVICAPFVAEGPTGVAIKTRLHVTAVEDGVLREVETFLGSLARRDLATRCRDGLAHNKDTWAARKRAITGESSSRWAGAITKASHDQWALARRCQAAHLANMDAGIATIRHRLCLPVGEKGREGAAGGYKSRRECHAKTRRLATLQVRRVSVAAERDAGRVGVVAGGRRLASNRHNLADAGLTGQQWRDRWDAARMLLSADGQAGKRYGNETIRVSPGGQVTVKLPGSIGMLRSGMPPLGSRTGHVKSAPRRSGSKTSTSPAVRPARSAAGGRRSGASYPGSRPPGSGPDSCRWPRSRASRSLPSTPPTHRGGVPDTGRNPSLPHGTRPPGTRPRAS